MDGTALPPPLPAIKPATPGAFPTPEGNSDEPEHRENHGGDPKHVYGESCTRENQH
jgi:hypothetical protein